MASNLTYLFNSDGDWIAFRIGNFIYNSDANWIGWFPWNDEHAVDTAGKYLGSIFPGRRFYRITYSALRIACHRQGTTKQPRSYASRICIGDEVAALPAVVRNDKVC